MIATSAQHPATKNTCPVQKPTPAPSGGDLLLAAPCPLLPALCRHPAPGRALKNDLVDHFSEEASL